MTMSPTLDTEQLFWKEGHTVVGLDEVGRGACAGGLSIGAAVLHPSTAIHEYPFSEVKDSKLLSKKKRTQLAPDIMASVLSGAVGSASAKEIDDFGITESLRRAAMRALAGLSVKPTLILLDGPFNYIKHPELKVVTVVKGDMSILSIAAASVIAKVSRDEEMRVLGETYPEYDFARNAGYLSPAHKEALSQHGLTAHHRASWSFAKPSIENPTLF